MRPAVGPAVVEHLVDNKAATEADKEVVAVAYEAAVVEATDMAGPLAAEAAVLDAAAMAVTMADVAAVVEATEMAGPLANEAAVREAADQLVAVADQARVIEATPRGMPMDEGMRDAPTEATGDVHPSSVGSATPSTLVRICLQAAAWFACGDCYMSMTELITCRSRSSNHATLGFRWQLGPHWLCCQSQSTKLLGSQQAAVMALLMRPKWLHASSLSRSQPSERC